MKNPRGFPDVKIYNQKQYDIGTKIYMYTNEAKIQDSSMGTHNYSHWMQKVYTEDKTVSLTNADRKREYSPEEE